MKHITIDIDGIKSDVLAADLHTIEGTSKLENILMTRYPARDVATFAGFVHQYQATPVEVRNFRTMFDRVMRRYETYRVLAADMGICDSKRVGGCLHIDESETEPTLLDYTISKIAQMVDAARKQIIAIETLLQSSKGGDRTSRPKVTRAMRSEIFDKWQSYTKPENHGPELPNGELRTTKPTVAEFYQAYENRYICTAPDGKKWTLRQCYKKATELQTAFANERKARSRKAK